MRDAVALEASYSKAVLEAGGIPLLVPPAPVSVLREYLRQADGFLLTGGNDYPPVFVWRKARPKRSAACPRARAERYAMDEAYIG